jgi:putative ABC transport system permease protein
MKPFIILKTAYLNLRNGKMRSVLTIGGVIVGIGSIIFLVSLGYGLERLVTSQVTNFQAFSQIDIPSASLKTLKIDEALTERVQGIPHIEQVGRITTLAGRLQDLAANQTAEVIVLAADDNYWQMAGQSLTSGENPKQNGELVINEALAKVMNLPSDQAVGRTVNLSLLVPKELINGAENIHEIADLPFTITGYTTEGSAPYVYFKLDVLNEQGLTYYSSLKVKVDDRDIVPVVRTQLENLGLATEYVGDTIKQISEVFTFFRVVLGAFGMIALVVASMGTFNVLTINLIERTKEIGLMKSLGMQNRDIYLLFISESLLISFFGGLIGLLIGISLGEFGNYILAQMAAASQVEAVQIFATPLAFTLGCGALSLVIGLVTGWYPARRAVKMNALEALRFE